MRVADAGHDILNFVREGRRRAVLLQERGDVGFAVLVRGRVFVVADVVEEGGEVEGGGVVGRGWVDVEFGCVDEVGVGEDAEDVGVVVGVVVL